MTQPDNFLLVLCCPSDLQSFFTWFLDDEMASESCMSSNKGDSPEQERVHRMVWRLSRLDFWSTPPRRTSSSYTTCNAPLLLHGTDRTSASYVSRVAVLRATQAHVDCGHPSPRPLQHSRLLLLPAPNDPSEPL